MTKRVLLISLGSIGRRHLRNTRAMLPDAEIGVFRQHTRSQSVVPEMADYLFSSMEDAVAFDPEAVIISSPASEHVACAEPFIAKGIPVFLEKPLADSSLGLPAFSEKVKQSGSFAMTGYVLRFLPALHTIRKTIDDGTLGQVRTAHVEVGQYLPDWRPDSDYRQGVSAQKALGGGCLLELSHELDYAMWLFGFPFSLQCSSSKLSDLEIDVEDSALVIMEYGQDRSEKRVVVQVDFLQRVPNMYVEIVGSEATLRADLIKEVLTLYTPETPDGHLLETVRLKEGNEIYLRQFDFFFKRSFHDYVPVFEETRDFDQWVDVEHATRVMQIVDLAKKADAEGCRQTVEGLF